MYDDFLLNNGFNYDLNLNLPYSANKPPLKLDDMDDERIEGEDSFFNEKLPNKLFKDGDVVETHFEKIIQSDTFFTTLNKKRNLSNDFLFKDEEEKEEKGEEIKEEEIGLLEDKEKGSDQIQSNEKVKKKKGNQGRKSFEDESEGKHTKDSEDNMLRKIKSYFVGSFHNYLN